MTCRGYPYGLKGEEVPLLARVIAVADTFDALTTNRPYQRAHDPVEALRIIQNLSGKRLDRGRGRAAGGVLAGRDSDSQITDDASLAIIGKSLGHLDPATTAIYARLNLDPVRVAVDEATDAMLYAAGVK